jgi:hypothetical protein
MGHLLQQDGRFGRVNNGFELSFETHSDFRLPGPPSLNDKARGNCSSSPVVAHR